jgi:diguanylate cyclase (GGDEF)-like protein
VVLLKDDAMPQLALHDDSTGLPNRLLLLDRVTQAIAHARREREKLAVLCLTLDSADPLDDSDGGDSGGHSLGNELLRSLGERLISGLRLTDTVSRVDAQEFVILVTHVAHEDQAALIAQKVLATVDETRLIASIGIGIYPDDGMDAETLIKNANFAMSSARNQGSDGYAFCKPHLNERTIERRFVESGLRHALDRHEFVLHYEPRIDLYSGAMVGAEALIRWSRPTRGMAPLPEFMSAAERSGYGIPIGLWALRTVCRQMRLWKDENLEPPPISIDTSGNELKARDFVPNVREILQESGLEPRQLELEVTELALENDLKSTLTVLRSLKDIGVKIALDHFGTGRSSLTHLKNIPLDTLKIDSSVVRGVCINAGDAGIVDAIIGAARSFHVRVTAAGVETREQFLALQNQGCTEGQGSYFRTPAPADEFAKLLKSDSCATTGV